MRHQALTKQTVHSCAPHFVADYIMTVCTNNSRSVYTNEVTRVCGSVGRLNPTTVVNDENSHFETLPQWRRPTLRPKTVLAPTCQNRSVTPHTLRWVYTSDGVKRFVALCRAFTRLSNARESVGGVPVYTSHVGISARQRAPESVAWRGARCNKVQQC